MEMRFVEERGLIWVDLGPSWRGFNRTLADAVTSLAPIGEPPGLSTYWIDRTLARLGAGDPYLTSGNESRLIERNNAVCAHSDYELFDDEEMPIEEFRMLLEEWRTEVERHISAGDTRGSDLRGGQRVPFESDSA